MSVQTANLSTLNSTLVIQTDVATLPSVGSVGVQVGGVFTGTLTFRATIDGANFFSVNGIPITAAGGSPTSTVTAPGQYAISVNGFAQVVIAMTSYTSGTATVSADVSVAAVPTTPLVSVSVTGSSNGGIPLPSGIPSGFSDDGTRNFQGSDSAQVQLLPTVAGQTFIMFVDNPWIQGLTLGAGVLLSYSNNGSATEEVIVAQNNVPSAGTGSFTVQIMGTVANTGETFATFDTFGVDGPTTVGINQSSAGPTVPGQSLIGVAQGINLLYNTRSVDPKRPLVPAIQAIGNIGVAAVQNVPDAMGANDLTIIRQSLERLVELANVTNYLLMQLKDGGAMDIPNGIFPEQGGSIQ